MTPSQVNFREAIFKHLYLPVYKESMQRATDLRYIRPPVSDAVMAFRRAEMVDKVMQANLPRRFDAASNASASRTASTSNHSTSGAALRADGSPRKPRVSEANAANVGYLERAKAQRIEKAKAAKRAAVLSYV